MNEPAIIFTEDEDTEDILRLDEDEIFDVTEWLEPDGWEPEA